MSCIDPLVLVVTGIVKMVILIRISYLYLTRFIMAKVPIKKSAVKPSTPDYFKLPFEVYYSEHIAVTMMELKSDIKVKKFEDVKIAHKEQGGSWGTSFFCSQNNGPELYCCIRNFHDEVDPNWLEFLDEDSMEMSYGCDYAVAVENDEIRFVELTDEQLDENSDEFLDVASMNLCCSYSFLVYELGNSCPDYLILDAKASRVKVNLEGFLIDDEGNSTDERIFNPEELDPDEFEDYTGQEFREAKSEWVSNILKKDFPKQKDKLTLSYYTE